MWWYWVKQMLFKLNFCYSKCEFLICYIIFLFVLDISFSKAALLRLYVYYELMRLTESNAVNTIFCYIWSKCHVLKVCAKLLSKFSAHYNKKSWYFWLFGKLIVNTLEFTYFVQIQVIIQVVYRYTVKLYGYFFQILMLLQ